MPTQEAGVRTGERVRGGEESRTGRDEPADASGRGVYRQPDREVVLDGEQEATEHPVHGPAGCEAVAGESGPPASMDQMCAASISEAPPPFTSRSPVTAQVLS